MEKLALAAHQGYVVAHDATSIQSACRLRRHTTKLLTKAIVVKNATNNTVACEWKAQSVRNLFRCGLLLRKHVCRTCGGGE
jgi:hypothetical protein